MTMTDKEAIGKLEELYPLVSEETKRAIDKSIEALRRDLKIRDLYVEPVKEEKDKWQV